MKNINKFICFFIPALIIASCSKDTKNFEPSKSSKSFFQPWFELIYNDSENFYESENLYDFKNLNAIKNQNIILTLDYDPDFDDEEDAPSRFKCQINTDIKAANSGIYLGTITVNNIIVLNPSHNSKEELRECKTKSKFKIGKTYLFTYNKDKNIAIFTSNNEVTKKFEKFKLYPDIE